MFDFTKLLHASIQLDQQITQDKRITWTSEESLRNAYVSLDVELAEVANTSEWFKVWKMGRGKSDPGKTARETLLTEYVDALDFILLISAKQQWTHLIVLDQDEIEKISSKPKADLNKEYLSLKKMFFWQLL
ncbi:dUTPase [Paucilactobacillus hokkaidonensis]|uniref:dUTPase n=1 Tax=Paucilactobacillus hokkaidonensis TaxID=1193095 RepID=UPI0006D079BD|nr:dUTPase [Paucilactobacillus hokkaidonensis]